MSNITNFNSGGLRTRFCVYSDPHTWYLYLGRATGFQSTSTVVDTMNVTYNPTSPVYPAFPTYPTVDYPRQVFRIPFTGYFRLRVDIVTYTSDMTIGLYIHKRSSSHLNYGENNYSGMSIITNTDVILSSVPGLTAQYFILTAAPLDAGDEICFSGSILSTGLLDVRDVTGNISIDEIETTTIRR